MSTYAPDIEVRRTGLTAYTTIAASALAVVFLSHYPTFNHLIYEGTELMWFYLAAGLLIVPVVFAEPERALRLLRSPFFLWFAAYVLTSLLWLGLAQDFSETGLARWRPRIAALGVFYAVALLASEGNRGIMALVIVACVAFASATTWYDVLRPYSFIPREFEAAHAGRGAGFFINPNVAGSFIAAAAIIALPFVPMPLRGPLVVCAAVGIVPTFSRSAYIYGVLILIAPLVLRLLNRTQAFFVLIMTPLLVAAAAASYDALLSASDDQNLHNVIRRLQWFQGLEAEDRAVEGRLHGAREAWQMFLDSPLLGAGLGMTTPASGTSEGPHNMYLMMLAEQGFLGLALYLALIAIFFREGRRRARAATAIETHDVGKGLILFSVMLFAWGFFDHNVLEQPFTMFLLGFIAAGAFHTPPPAHVYERPPAAAVVRPRHTRHAAG